MGVSWHNYHTRNKTLIQIEWGCTIHPVDKHCFRHSNVSSMPSLFHEVVGELSSCFLNLFLESFPVCISESQDSSCWGCNANSTFLPTLFNWRCRCLSEELNEGSDWRYWWKSEVLHWWGYCLDDLFPECILPLETIMWWFFSMDERWISSKILIEFTSEIDQMLCSLWWCVKLFSWCGCVPRFLGSFVDDVSACEGFSRTSYTKWCCLHEEHYRTRFYV